MWLRWPTRVWLVVGNTASLSFTLGVAVFYRYSLTNTAIQIGLLQLGANTLTFFVPMIVATATTSVVHMVVILHSLAPTRRFFASVLHGLQRSRTTRIQPTIVSVVPKPLHNAGGRLAAGTTLVSRAWWRHSDEITRLFMVWEIALQTFQAYKISYLVASVSINRLVAIVIVTNCWFSPILQYVMGSRPAAQVRLGRLLVDSSLDLVYNILIPLAIFYPYVRDFNNTLTLYPLVYYYDDTWYVNALSELRQIFVTSWPDFISKMSGSLSLVYRLWKVKTALDDVASTDTMTTSVSAALDRHTGTEHPLRWYRSRLTRLLDLVLMVWGATVFSFHLTTTITSFRFYDPDCLLEMRPWGSLAYSCASLEISCAKRHTTGDKATMDAILSTVDPGSVQNLILSNCAQLHVPPTVQKLQYLAMIKIYNSTIASWDAQAALRQSCHPQVQVVYFARVNASAFPEGLLAEDFPSTLWDIEFCITNISSFPPAITNAWTNVGIFAYEGNPEQMEFPEVLTTLPNIIAFSFGHNNIQTLGDGVLQPYMLVGLGMNGNPIERLPDSIGSIDRLELLDFMDTMITSIPAAWTDIAVPDYKASESVVLFAAGSPLCASHQAQPVTKPAWLGIRCDKAGIDTYEYPIGEEDAWRAINQ